MIDAGTAIERALAFLARQQLPSGGFPVYMWRATPGAKPGRLDSAIFPASIIAHCLSYSSSEPAKAMLARARQFLLNEMEPGGVWRYRASDHPHYSEIPPDVDDTACASAVLRQMGVSFPDNRRLILANRDSRGLFYTWITPRFRWSRSLTYWKVVLPQLRHPRSLYRFWKLDGKPNDVDFVVNANVISYLGSSGMQPVIDFIVDVIRRQKEVDCDKWYLNPLVIYYFISRCFAGGITELAVVREPVIERIRALGEENGDIGTTSLETAAAICSFLNWNVDSDLDGMVSLLLRKQQKNGSWERDALYGGGIMRWGSEECATALCLEALVRYAERERKR